VLDHCNSFQLNWSIILRELSFWNDQALCLWLSFYIVSQVSYPIFTIYNRELWKTNDDVVQLYSQDVIIVSVHICKLGWSRGVCVEVICRTIRRRHVLCGFEWLVSDRCISETYLPAVYNVKSSASPSFEPSVTPTFIRITCEWNVFGRSVCDINCLIQIKDV